MNRFLMGKIFTAIETAEANKLAMHSWVSPIYPPPRENADGEDEGVDAADCDTAMCVAGWALAMVGGVRIDEKFPTLRDALQDIATNITGRSDSDAIPNAAALVLDLTPSQKSRLFFPWNFDGDLQKTKTPEREATLIMIQRLLREDIQAEVDANPI